jgi:hypothetical protein
MPRSRPTLAGAGLSLLCVLAGAPLRAQEPAPSPAPTPSPAPEATPSPESARTLRVGGFVDAYYAYNGNRPADHANFFPGVGTSAKRHNEVSVNLAQVDLTLDPQPVGFRLALGFGTSTEVVHSFEPSGPFVGPEVWKHIVQASVQWNTGLGRGLLLEGGVYPCHIGMEAFQTKDNWNYTRSWLGELSPYYSAGLKLAYPFNDSWSGQLHFLNGWQTIGDNNDGKSLGGQLAYAASKLSVSLNGFVGPELAGNNDDLRLMGDVVVTYKVTPSVALGLSADAATEGRPDGSDVGWAGVGLYARFAPPEGRTALALRAEYYDDEDGAISGIAQTLKEVTATLEHRPADHLILKLEGRYDKSSADVFGRDVLDVDGAPLRKDSQFIILLGAVAHF